MRKKKLRSIKVCKKNHPSGSESEQERPDDVAGEAFPEQPQAEAPQPRIQQVQVGAPRDRSEQLITNLSRRQLHMVGWLKRLISAWQTTSSGLELHVVD
jgi:hypothetical protein